MDVDPLEHVEDDDEKKDGGEKPKSNLNRWVAVTVAILATFMGICKVKDDNIVQAMQQAQADKIDNFAWYQARNIREDVARATSAQFAAQLAAAPPANQAAIQQQLDTYNALAKDQEEKKKQQQDAAEQADKTYNQLNLHDDQFDMADAALSIAISLLAVTALTQKRWLFFLALVPTFFGLLMGLAGLLGWSLHPDAIARLLS
jgi:ABC-type Zn2+ transport system substrate-binding protein/surface adhesin